ncbi:MAG: tRNA pseudouridine(38-40) synthase TruA [Gemmatimonadetes bacterium]|nr:tRNA pseudouridine(38-40) synthase TruA [Gemmatimonadota bacterium]
MDTGTTIRFLLTVHYDGSGFHGWQFQPELRTVQGELEGVLGRLAGRPRTVVGSGRTDTGVHAVGQVASVDMPTRWTARELHRALNATLPPDVWVQEVAAARPDFHPRYDALSRTYVYRVGTTPVARSPFHRRWCWPLGESLDVPALNRLSVEVVGEHSFGAFAKAGQPERGTRCTVATAHWDAWDMGTRFTITADRYLHHMVRYLVGTMVDIARGRRATQDLSALLVETVGVETSPPAPPEGLFLSQVEYPDTVRLPGGARPSKPHAEPRSETTR